MGLDNYFKPHEERLIDMNIEQLLNSFIPFKIQDSDATLKFCSRTFHQKKDV